MEPSHLIACPIVIDNTGEELNDLIHNMATAAGSAVKKVASLKTMPWIRVESLGQDIIKGNLFFVLNDLENVEEAKDVALRAMAVYTVKPYGPASKGADASAGTGAKTETGSTATTNVETETKSTSDSKSAS